MNKLSTAFINVNDQVNDENNSITQVIISREACVFGCIDFSDTKKNLIKSSLEIQLKRLSPFSKYDSHVIWKDNHAMFWLWASLKDHNNQPLKPSIKIIPESLLRGIQIQSGFELIAMQSGYEARNWKAGLMIGSQFWPVEPTLSQWNNFLSNHSTAQVTELPVIKRNSQLEAPWHQLTVLESVQGKLQDINVPALVLALFLIIMSYQLTSYVHIQQQLNSIKELHNTALDKASDIVTARNNALQELAIIQNIHALSRWPTQIELLAVCNQILNNLQAKMFSWKYDRGEILLVIKTDNTDVTAFVSNFEKSGLFSSVTINTQTNRGDLTLQLNLKSLVETVANDQNGQQL